MLPCLEQIDTPVESGRFAAFVDLANECTRIIYRSNVPEDEESCFKKIYRWQGYGIAITRNRMKGKIVTPQFLDQITLAGFDVVPHEGSLPCNFFDAGRLTVAFQ